MKYRTVGIAIDMFQAMGAAVNGLPGGEVVSAMDRGLLDAAEFNNASSDRALGFPDVSKVCMLQSYHQNAEQLVSKVWIVFFTSEPSDCVVTTNSAKWTS